MMWQKPLVAGSEPYQRLKSASVGARVEVIGLLECPPKSGPSETLGSPS